MPDIAYWKFGKGQAVVFAARLLVIETNEIWQEFVPPIIRFLRSMVSDLPGFGESPPLLQGYAFTDVSPGAGGMAFITLV